MANNLQTWQDGVANNKDSRVDWKTVLDGISGMEHFFKVFVKNKVEEKSKKERQDFYENEGRYLVDKLEEYRLSHTKEEYIAVLNGSEDPANSANIYASESMTRYISLRYKIKDAEFEIIGNDINNLKLSYKGIQFGAICLGKNGLFIDITNSIFNDYGRDCLGIDDPILRNLFKIFKKEIKTIKIVQHFVNKTTNKKYKASCLLKFYKTKGFKPTYKHPKIKPDQTLVLLEDMEVSEELK